MRKSLIVIAGCLVVTTFALGSGGVISDTPAESPLQIDFPEEERSEAQLEQEEVLILPGYTAKADPKVKNNGSIDAYVFMKVEVPVVEATEVELEKTVAIRSDGLVPVMAYTPEEPWTLIEESVTDGILTQVYSYGSLTALQPGEETPPLFTSWTVIDCRVENSRTGSTDWSVIEELCPQTAINCYSIQATVNGTVNEIWQMAH